MAFEVGELVVDALLSHTIGGKDVVEALWIVLIRQVVGLAATSEHRQLLLGASRPWSTHPPVEPNPASARTDSGSSSTSMNRARSTRWMTSCASRSPRCNRIGATGSRLTTM